MKKILTMLMAVMMIFTSASFVVFAGDEVTEEKTTTAVATEDTHVAAANPDTNYSSEKLIQPNNRTDSYKREGYVKFNLDSLGIPEGSEITGAKITMNVGATYSTSQHILLFDIPASTDLSAVVADNMPERGSEVSRVSITAGVIGDFDLDITSCIQALPALKGDIAFAVTGTLNKALYITSLEGDPALAPRISVSYIAPEEGTASAFTLDASEDTYVNGREATTNYSSATELQSNNVTTDYFREIYVRFNLSNIVIPDGFEINTVTFTANNAKTWGTATEATLYPVSNDINFEELNYNTRPTKGASIASAAFEAKTTGTFDIDITEYIKSFGVTGNVTFAINGNSQKSLYLSSLETGDGLYPKLTVTFVKASEKTQDRIYVNDTAAFALYNAGLKDTSSDAADVVYTPYANEDGIYTISTASDKELCDEENRYVMMKFDISSLEVPEEKVIKSAVLKNYYKKNYSEQPVIVEALGVSDASFSSAGATWNNQPETDGSYIGHCTVDGSASSNVVNAYVDMDITPYFTSKYYGEEASVALALHVSGIYKKANGATGSVEMQAYSENGLYNPYIEVTYGEASNEITFDKVNFYQTRYNTEVSELSSGRVIVEVPVDYSGSDIREYKVYLAVYEKADQHKLIAAYAKDISFAATNGGSVTAIFDTSGFDVEYTWKAFVFGKNLMPTDAVEVISPAAAQE